MVCLQRNRITGLQKLNTEKEVFKLLLIMPHCLLCTPIPSPRLFVRKTGCGHWENCRQRTVNALPAPDQTPPTTRKATLQSPSQSPH